MAVKYLLWGLFISCYTLSFSQEWTFNQFYSKYKHSGSEFHISLGWPVLKIASLFVRDEPEKTLVKSIKKIKVIAFEETPAPLYDDLDALVRGLQRNHYEEWLTVREPGEHVRVLVNEKEDHIRDFVILADEEDEFVLVSIEGKVDRKVLQAFFDKN